MTLKLHVSSDWQVTSPNMHNQLFFIYLLHVTYKLFIHYIHYNRFCLSATQKMNETRVKSFSVKTIAFQGEGEKSTETRLT